MRLALMVTPECPVPPPAYGGAERCADAMVRWLMQHGHEVDLYCGPDSTCPAVNVIMARRPSMGEEPYLLEQVEKRIKEYDCVIDYTAHHLAGQKLDNVVSLMGGDPHKKYPHDEVKNKVYKSKEFAHFNGNVNGPIIPNLIEVDPWSVPYYGTNEEGGYPLYVGHILPMKGVHMAASACRKKGLKLVVYGEIKDAEYWDAFKDSVDYRGVLGSDRQMRNDAFGNAAVFLHPVQVCDCDPLAPKEAMLRGTPVIACPIGGLLSSVSPGISGFFARTTKEFVAMLQSVLFLERQGVRQDIFQKVNPDIIMPKLLFLCDRAGRVMW